MYEPIIVQIPMPSQMCDQRVQLLLKFANLNRASNYLGFNKLPTLYLDKLLYSYMYNLNRTNLFLHRQKWVRRQDQKQNDNFKLKNQIY